LNLQITMPTVINNPSGGNSGDGGMGAGLILGIIIAVLVIIVLFFVYGWPALRGVPQNQGTNINVEIPNPTDGGGDQGGNQPAR